MAMLVGYSNLLHLLILHQFTVLNSIYQRTPLHIAAREGYFNTAKSLSDKGADITIEDVDGVSEILCGRFKFDLASIHLQALRDSSLYCLFYATVKLLYI